MSVYRNLEGSVILLIDSDKRIAMQLRDNKPGLPAANKWALFGGLISGDETPTETIIREVREELSIVLDLERLSLLYRHYIPEQNLTTWVFCYSVDTELDNAVLLEGQAWDFIDRNDPKASEIGLHHYEIVHDFWSEH